MAALTTRRYRADVAAGLCALAYFAWLAVRTPGTPASQAVGELAFYPLGLLVAWAFWRNTRIAGLDARTRAGWWLLALASGLIWLSGSAWSLYLHVVPPTRVPDWIDRLELMQALCTLAGCFAFPNTSPLRKTSTRYLLDLALTIVAGFVLAVYFLVRVQDLGAGVSTMVVAGSVIDWLLFVVMAVGFARKRDRRIRNTMGWLIGAQLVYLLANYLYAAGIPTYRTGDAVDGVWFFAWVLRWGAARHAWHGYAREGPEDRSVPAAQLAYRSSLFSYTIVASAFLLVLVQLFLDRQHIEVATLSASVMAIILLVRQFAEIQENRRLFADRLSQEARFRSLVQQSSDVVLVADGQGIVHYVSPSAARVFGSPPTIEPGVLLRAVLSPASGARLESLFEAGPGTGRPLPARVRTASGDSRDVEIVWSDLRQDPTVAGIVLSCRDVTERNELERRLQHAQKLDAVGHLAGGLAHDFNNVLTVIRGYTELLRADLPVDAPAVADLVHMEQAVDRASAVTKKLLAFSRRQSVQPVVLDLNAIVRDLLPIFRQLLTAGVEVTLDLAPGLVPVKADAGQLEQVMINLATNARDAMPQGGHLHVVTENASIDAQSPMGLQPGTYASLTMTDTGGGMDAATQARIFDPFFSTKPKDRGVGLGLAMVHGIVSAAGGGVEVRSAPGEGAKFTILLPKSDEATIAPKAPEVPPAPVRRAVTVLVVDDEPAVRTVARRFLETNGYAVIEADGGERAVELLENRALQIDVVLTDMIMPGTSGRDVIARARAARPATPVVVMTGFAGEERTAGGDAAVAAVVTKPFSAGVLVRAVAAAHEAAP